MPVINIVLSEQDHQQLERQYATLVSDWPRLEDARTPPAFLDWLCTRVVTDAQAQAHYAALSDIRVFNAIEKLVTNLPRYGFHLAHTALQNVPPETSAQKLAEAMVDDLTLQSNYAKRLQDLFRHYLKSAKEIADVAQVGITNRAYGALTEAHRRLLERTTGAISKLGAEKAIGRVEGATAILVGLDVMDRGTAKKRTTAFKAEANAVRKTGWVGRMFREP
ncbi:MAG: hypothetical protein NVSMB6_24800 [Burkholderiaceae bacterium]